jgi:hypothetical protein
VGEKNEQDKYSWCRITYIRRYVGCPIMRRRLIKPVITRWNSYYSALERATYLKGGFDLYIEKHVSRVAYEERRDTQSDAPA